jgi:hypothetical protein
MGQKQYLQSPQHNTIKLNPAVYEEDYTQGCSGIYYKNLWVTQYWKISVIFNINRMKGKNKYTKMLSSQLINHRHLQKFSQFPS